MVLEAGSIPACVPVGVWCLFVLGDAFCKSIKVSASVREEF